MYPLKNAKGSNALLPIFVNLKSNTMKKSRCKDKAYFRHLQEFSEIFSTKACFITYFYVFILKNEPILQILRG
jgi:hypothetical protein